MEEQSALKLSKENFNPLTAVDDALIPVSNRMGFWKTFSAYIELTKPRSVILLVFTALVTMMAAVKIYGPVSLSHYLIALASVTLACSGANAISCYVDRDLDASMERTRHRPIPQGRINPPINALLWGTGLFLVALFLAWLLNPLSQLCLWGGMIGYVGVYSLWLKRRSSWNIILGGFSGGLPALFGWTAVSGQMDLFPLLISALVVLWIPNHIWSLAIFYSDDYRKVKVPMLPVVSESRKALNCLLSTVILMFILSILIYFIGSMSYWYLGTALVTGLAMLTLSSYVYLKPGPKSAWLLFKFSSPYLAIILLSLMTDVYLG